MNAQPFPPKRRTLWFAIALLTLLPTLACVDKPAPGGTADTRLYLYDNASKTVKVWDDVNALYTATEAPDPSRDIRGERLAKVGTLGWGGMAMDGAGDRLYLVSAAGVVTRLEKVSSLNGKIKDATSVATFTLGDGAKDAFSGGSVFGQAAVNGDSDMLYVTETSKNRQATRLWKVPHASTAQGHIPLDKAIKGPAGDRGSLGVAAGKDGMVYAYFAGGEPMEGAHNGEEHAGARLRFGQGQFEHTVLGDRTLLRDKTTTYGTLAYDPGREELYVARQASRGSHPAVVVFKADQLDGRTLDPAPSRSLGDASTHLKHLRFITHGGAKDWLAGADLEKGKGTHFLHLWKAPHEGGSATTITLDSDLQVGGLAFDGQN
jgi:hypothetical protein